MLAEIQVSPRPAGDERGPLSHIDAALELIRASGLNHEVHALGMALSGLPRQTGTAAALAIGAWLILVVLYVGFTVRKRVQAKAATA